MTYNQQIIEATGATDHALIAKIAEVMAKGRANGLADISADSFAIKARNAVRLIEMGIADKRPDLAKFSAAFSRAQG